MNTASIAIAKIMKDVFRSRLVGVALHGSAVTGDAFDGLSDLDFAVVLRSTVTSADAAAMAGRIDQEDITPFAYVQATYERLDEPKPSVVPGAFSVLYGEVDGSFQHTAASLQVAATKWLDDLPRLTAQDIQDWSVAVDRRPRQLRLILTRLKPTVRAHLVQAGDDPTATYATPWPGLVDRFQARDPGLAADLAAFITGLPGELDWLSLGDEALALLVRFTDLPALQEAGTERAGRVPEDARCVGGCGRRPRLSA